MLEKCLLTVRELIWNQRLEHRKTKLNICHHMPTSSIQLQNSSSHVVERTRTSTKCQKNEKCTCKACKNIVFHCQLCKFVGFLLPKSWLHKLPIRELKQTRRRRKRERHLKMRPRVSAIIFQLLKVIMLSKMSKNEKCTCKACKITVFHRQICKFVGVLLPKSWLHKLPMSLRNDNGGREERPWERGCPMT